MTISEFEHLYTKHKEQLMRVARKFGGNDAKDILQESMLRAWKYRDTFQEETNWRAWASQIVHNIALNNIRNLKRAQVIDVENFDETFHEFADKHQSINQPEISVFSDEVHSALKTISKRRRDFVLAIDIEGIPYDVLAAQLGISKNAIKVQINRAHHDLARKLKTYGASEYGYKKFKFAKTNVDSMYYKRYLKN